MKEPRNETTSPAGRPAAPDGERPLTIAVDFDGVLFDHVPYMLRGFRDAYGIDLAAEGLRHWDFFQYRAIQQRGLSYACVRKVMDLLETDPVLHKRPPRDPLAPAVIRAWRAQGHKVHIVTARQEMSRPVTSAFLERYRIAHDGLVMEARLKTGYDVLIDDAPHNVLTAAADGSLAVLMDHPYNRDVPAHTNPKRAADWRQVPALVEASVMRPPAHPAGLIATGAH